METQTYLLGPSRLHKGENPSPLIPLHHTMSFACFNSLNAHRALFPLQMGKLRHSTFLFSGSLLQTPPHAIRGVWEGCCREPKF